MTQPHKLKLPVTLPGGLVPFQVGAGPLLLGHSYDPGQYWLPGMNVIFFHHPDPAAMEPAPPREDRIVPSDADRVLYRYTAGVPQMVLPFPDRREVYAAEYKRLRNTGFPGWERTADGEIATIKLSGIRARIKFRTWCAANCTGRFHVRPDRHVLFELVADAAAAALNRFD